MYDNTLYGVIGGLGSYAGLDIVKRLNERVSQRNSQLASEASQRYTIVDSDFPEVVYYQIPFQGVSSTGELKDGHELETVLDIEKGLVKAKKYFDFMGVSKTLFACNTYNKMISMSPMESENVSLTDAFDDIVSNAEGKVLLLASVEKTNKVKEGHPYSDKLLFLDSDQQSVINEIINTSIFRGQDYTSSDRLYRLIGEVLGDEYKQASNVLLACTELSLYYHDLVYRYETEGILADYLCPQIYDTVEKSIETMTGLKEVDRGRIVLA